MLLVILATIIIATHSIHIRDDQISGMCCGQSVAWYRDKQTQHVFTIHFTFPFRFLAKVIESHFSHCFLSKWFLFPRSLSYRSLLIFHSLFPPFIYSFLCLSSSSYVFTLSLFFLRSLLSLSSWELKWVHFFQFIRNHLCCNRISRSSTNTLLHDKTVNWTMHIYCLFYVFWNHLFWSIFYSMPFEASNLSNTVFCMYVVVMVMTVWNTYT